MADLEPGTVLAGYRVEAVAGRGGMGVVYRATQLALDRPVALKLISGDLAQDPEFRQRFRRESKTAASIEHPHVIPVYEAGEHDGLLFISMRFVEGTDLRAVLDRDGRLDPRRGVRILAQVGSALDAAHAAGLVHRDIKPGNVLLSVQDGADHAFLSDFGLTKSLGSQSALTQTGVFVGTLDYMAPEQIKGERVDARTDVYSLGCVLYEMLTGDVPFRRESDVAKLWAHMNDPPPSCAQSARELGAEIDRVVSRALAKEAEERYPSASDLARAAEAAIEQRPVAAPERSVARGAAAPDATRISRKPTATVVSPSRRRDRRPTLALAGAAAAGALVATALALALAGGDDGGEREAGTSFEGRGFRAATVRVDSPAGLAIGDAAIWVANYEKASVTRIESDSGRTGPTIPVGDGPGALALVDGVLWVAQVDDGSIARVDVEEERVVGTPIEAPAGFGDSLEPAGDSLWAALPGEGAVARIDRSSGEIVSRVRIPGGVAGDIALEGRTLWVVNADESAVTPVDTDRGRPGEPVVLGEDPEDAFRGQLALAAGSVWVTGADDETLWRIDPRRREVTGELRLEEGIEGDLATGRGAVWLLNEPGEIVEVDPSTGRPADPPQPIGINTGAEEMEVATQALWLVGGTDEDTVVAVEF